MATSSSAWLICAQAACRAFGAQLHRHPLAAEITVSQLCNRIVDRAGASFLTWTDEPSPRVLGRAVSLYLLFDRALDAAGLNRAIRDATGLAPDTEIGLLLRVEDALQSLCRWGLSRSVPTAADEATTALWRGHWTAFGTAARSVRTDAERAAADQEAESWRLAGLSRDLADSLALLDLVDDFPHVVAVQQRSAGDAANALRGYRRVAAWFGWPAIKQCMSRMGLDDGQQSAVAAVQGRLLDAFARLCIASAAAGSTDPGRFLETLRDRGLLSRIPRIKQRLASAASQRLVELLVVLLAEAEAAADDCSGPSAWSFRQ
jgi:glutamate dehydrogenase